MDRGRANQAFVLTVERHNVATLKSGRMIDASALQTTKMNTEQANTLNQSGSSNRCDSTRVKRLPKRTVNYLQIGQQSRSPDGHLAKRCSELPLTNS